MANNISISIRCGCGVEEDEVVKRGLVQPQPQSPHHPRRDGGNPAHTYLPSKNKAPAGAAKYAAIRQRRRSMPAAASLLDLSAARR
jgi:hypothetical protein